MGFFLFVLAEGEYVDEMKMLSRVRPFRGPQEGVWKEDRVRAREIASNLKKAPVPLPDRGG